MFSKLAMYAVAAVVLSGGAWGLVKLHDSRVVAAVAEKEKTLNAETAKRDALRLADAMTARAAQEAAFGATLAQIKEAIAHAPHSTSCAGSAPVRAAVSGLRNLGGNAGAAP